MFTGEVDCTYFFTWDTRYACVEEKEALLCGVADGRQRFDLSALARHSGRPARLRPRAQPCLAQSHAWSCQTCFPCQLITRGLAALHVSQFGDQRWPCVRRQRV